jgi:RES domain-containing protein
LVPSVATRIERNIVMNQEHPDFGKIRASKPMLVRWDERLWS